MVEKEELAKLRLLQKKQTSSLVVIRGRRRIGKSRLAQEFASQCRCLQLAGLAPSENLSAKDQREEFAQSLSIQCDTRPPRSDDWTELFWHLAKQLDKSRTVIILDEINWMGSKDQTFLAKLKNAWDLYFSKQKNLVMILCGSMSLWIEENILKSTGFMGRVSLSLLLTELPLRDCRAFWGSRANRTSAADILKILSITGGVPRYLEEIIPEMSAEQNILRLCYDSDGLLFNEYQHIFNDLFGRRRNVCQRLVTALADGPKSLKDLNSALEVGRTGKTLDYLNDLEQSGFICRDYSWNFQDGSESKKSRFRLSDNYLRFYLKYILPKRKQIERKALHSIPNFSSIMGLQFENLVLNNRPIIWDWLALKPQWIVNDNPYLQTATKNRPGCQIDYLIQSSDFSLYLCEIKFSMRKIGKTIIQEINQKIDSLARPKSHSIRPVLIHINGVTPELEDSNYFDRMIDFSKTLDPE